MQDEAGGKASGFRALAGRLLGRSSAKEGDGSDAEEKLEALVANAPDAVVSSDGQGRITEFNAAAERLFRVSAGEALDRPLSLLFPERLHEALRRGFSGWLQAEQGKSSDSLTGLCRDGSEIPLDVVAFRWGHADRSSATAFLRARRPPDDERALPKDALALEDVLRAVAAGVFIFQEGRVRHANPAASALSGYRLSELLGLSNWAPFHPDHLDVLRGTGAPESFRRGELPLITKNGEERWADVTTASVAFEDRPALMAIAYDVTERRLAEKALREAERRMSDLLENVRLIAVLLDTEGDVTFANQYLVELLGCEEEEVVGLNWFDGFLPAEMRETSKATYRDRIGLGMVAPHDESEIVTRGGERRLVSWSHTVLHDLAGAVVGMAAIGTDVTERRRVEQQLLHSALHDGLTGLPNRALFMDRLGGTLARARRRPWHLFAVLFLDLDRFRLVNESLGHATGDQLLLSFSAVLKKVLRPGDTLSRLGGDEFAILLDEIEDGVPALRVAQSIQEALNTPFNLGTHEVFVTTSIGIALSSAGYERGDDMLRDAHTAMYEAKAGGKAGHRVFDSSMRSRAVRLMELESNLRRAVEHEEFILHYQPIVELSDGRICGFEALVRWEHPEHGLVSPLEFIHVAEETGLIFEIGRWALREACLQVLAWGPEVPPDLTISVNLSSRQFSQANLVDQIDGILQETGLEPTRLKLEITESVIMENADSAINILNNLRQLGTHVCIDDFGTGYSSLSYLLRFPADTLKIDRAFTRALLEGGRNAQIVRTIVLLGRSLEMDVVAEGVENEEQRAQLLAMDCQYGQGFFFSRPVDGERAGALLLTGTPRGG